MIATTRSFKQTYSDIENIKDVFLRLQQGVPKNYENSNRAATC